MNEKKYNLIEEPWIKVLDKNNNTLEVSLKDLFKNAHNYTGLAGETPTQDAAIFRLLLAIVLTIFYRYDSKGISDNILEYEEPELCILERWKQYWELGVFNGDVFDKYLEKYRERFYLFHPVAPFWQTADMVDGTKYDVKCLLGNMKESNNKDTKHHFSMSDGESLNRLDYSEICRWLVYQNAYSVNVKTRIENNNIPTKVGRLGQLGLIIINEDNLFKKLMINLCPIKNGSELWGEPKPVWEKDVCKTPGLKVSPPDNLPELYTIQSRRMILMYDDNENITGYRSIGGEYYDTDNDPTEQMSLLHRIKDNKSKTEKIVPKLHDINISVWREIPTLLLDKELIPGLILWIRLLQNYSLIDSDKIVTIRMIGLEYGDGMSYTNGNIISDSVSMSTNLLSELGKIWINIIQDEINNCIDVKNKVFYILAKAISDKSYNSDKQKTKMISDKLETRFYFLIDSEFRTWLQSIRPDIDKMDKKQSEWQEIAFRIALDVINNYLLNLNILKSIEISDAFIKSNINLRNIYKITEGKEKE